MSCGPREGVRDECRCSLCSGSRDWEGEREERGRERYKTGFAQEVGLACERGRQCWWAPFSEVVVTRVSPGAPHSGLYKVSESSNGGECCRD